MAFRSDRGPVIPLNLLSETSSLYSLWTRPADFHHGRGATTWPINETEYKHATCFAKCLQYLAQPAVSI